MTITSTELARLAEAATPGEWWLSTGVRVRFARYSSERPDEGCWPWTGPTLRRDGRGYLIVRKPEGGASSITAPRISFAIHSGQCPGIMMVCHSCDNPNCVNPEHLWLGTAADNYWDMRNKGRHSKPPPSKPRSHCARGHELTPENSVSLSLGGRACRLCKAVSQKAYLKKWRAARRNRKAPNND